MKLLTRSGICKIAVSFLLSAALIPPQIGNAASIVDLGTLPGSESSDAFAINDAGQVVGQATLQGLTTAVLWQNGTPTMIGFPYGFGIGFGGSARDINNSGQIVGWDMQVVGQGRESAVTWQNGVRTWLDNAYPVSSALGINNSGQIVGFANSPAYQAAVDAPSLYWQNAVPAFSFEGEQFSSPGVPLSYPGSPDFSAIFNVAINNAGQIVVGNLLLDHGTVTNLMAGLPTQFPGYFPGFWQGEANGINNAGQVIGTYIPFGGGSIGHAFLWMNGVLTDLNPNSTPSNFIGPESRANAINDAGQTVGMFNGHPVLWQNGTMTDLNGLLPANSGWVLSEARDINNNNQIVGTGTIDGQTHAFLLTVPEPSTFALGILGVLSLAVLGRRHRRRRLLA